MFCLYFPFSSYFLLLSFTSSSPPSLLCSLPPSLPLSFLPSLPPSLPPSSSTSSWTQGLAENKSTLGPEEVRKSALALVMGALDNPNPILRCAAGEALGRMAQVVGEATFIARMAQYSFDK